MTSVAKCVSSPMLLFVCRAVGVVALLGASAEGNSTAPVWPDQFHAVLLQNRSGDLALVDLYYDWTNGRNYNIVKPQLDVKDTMYDLEYNNGSTFYYFPGKAQCNVIEMGVGILRPTWLGDSGTYLGVETVDDFKCDVWNASNGFAIWYVDQTTRLPVHWRFGGGAEFHVMAWNEGIASPLEPVPMACQPGPPGGQGREVTRAGPQVLMQPVLPRGN